MRKKLRLWLRLRLLRLLRLLLRLLLMRKPGVFIFVSLVAVVVCDNGGRP
jgi:hypothetical protein